MKLGFTSKAIVQHEEAMALRKGRIYISGKISGLPDLNERKFARTENWLYFRYGTDLKIVNPHKLPHLHDKQWQSYMREDLRYLMACSAVVVLDDWKDSRGAIVEILLAHGVKLPVYDIENGDLRRIQIGFWLKLGLYLKLILKLV